MDNYLKAVALIEAHPHLKRFVGKTDQALVEKAEQFLGVIFPPIFRQFLQDFGCGLFGAVQLCGVLNDNFEQSGTPNGVGMTRELRTDYKLPLNLFFLRDGGGIIEDEYIIVNINDENYGSIVIYEAVISKYEQKIEVISDDFGAYFLSLIRGAIERSLRVHNERLEKP